MEKYGNAATEDPLLKELLLGQSENQVEYDQDCERPENRPSEEQV